MDQPISPSDPLVQHAAELQKPKTYEHAFFGTLIFDRKTDWYRVNTTWVGKAVELCLSIDDEHLEIALQVAQKLWNDQISWNQRIEDFVVQEMLTLYNDGQEDWPGSGWREDDPELTPEQFMSRIHLETIRARPNGEFEFHFDAGVLFAEHNILIRGNLRDGLTRADI